MSNVDNKLVITIEFIGPCHLIMRSLRMIFSHKNSQNSMCDSVLALDLAMTVFFLFLQVTMFPPSKV